MFSGFWTRRRRFPLRIRFWFSRRTGLFTISRIRIRRRGAAAGAPFQVHRSAMAASVRNYQPGDRFSALDWKTSARRNELMTKEFDPLQSVNMTLLLDCIPSPSFEAAVSASASLLYTALVKGSPAGFISLGSDRTVFPSGRETGISERCCVTWHQLQNRKKLMQAGV